MRSVIMVCLYCDGPVVDVDEGEHIIQDALGGFRTILNVCGVCNNYFSDLDKFLISRSLLTPIASQEMMKQKDEGNISWSYAPALDNLIYQTHIDWSKASETVTLPQLILDDGKLGMLGEPVESSLIGDGEYCRRLCEAAKNSLRIFRESNFKKGLHFHHFKGSPGLLKLFRYPPRIFAMKKVSDFTSSMKMHIGSIEGTDLAPLFKAIDDLKGHKGEKPAQILEGVGNPYYMTQWCNEVNVLTLLKMAINALSDTAKMPVNRHTFPETIACILDDGVRLTKEGIEMHGFVIPDDLKEIHRIDNGHAIRLTYFEKLWHVYFSFFGGRAAAFVRFKGPNTDEFNTYDITTPLTGPVDASSKWLVQRSKHPKLITVRIPKDSDSRAIIPSFEYEPGAITRAELKRPLGRFKRK